MNIAEIARRAKVSTATVSRTINQSGPVKPATARKIWRVVTELNYYPNSHARAHSARTRRQAFVDALRRRGLVPDRKFIREGTHTAEGGQREMAALLRLARRPTAVVASNDWTAIGALHAIHAAGPRPGRCVGGGLR